MRPWYEELFDNYGRQYDRQIFTSGTVGEVEFIEQEIGHDRTVRILDVGCGTGRHAIELARRGYTVVGVDLSAAMLARGREKAAAAGVSIDLRHADARDLPFRNEFGLVLMLCEGAFPLMETDEMNHQILRSAVGALTDRGTLVFTTLNGLYPLHHSVKDFLNTEFVDSRSIANHFDLMTFRDHSTFEFTDDDDRVRTVTCNERYYVPSEITWQLRGLGCSTVEIFAARMGAFSRQDRLTTEDFEMLVIARR